MIKFINCTIIIFLFKGGLILNNTFINNCNNKEFDNLIINVKKALASNNLIDANKFLIKSKKKINKCNYNKIVFHSYKGYILRVNRQYDSAFYQYNNALKLNTKKNKDYFILKSSTYKGLAVISSEINRQKEYLNYLKKALKYSNLSKDSLSIFSSLNNLGVYYNKYKDFKKSIYYYKKALSFSKDQMLLYQNIGSAYLLKNNSDSSYFYLNKSLKLAKDSITLSLIYLNLSKIAHKKKEHKKNIQYLLKSLSYLNSKKTIGSENKLIVLKHLFNANYELKKYKEAISYLELYNDLKYSLQNENIINNINSLNIKYQTAEKEKEILIEKQKNKQKQNFLIAALLSLFLISIIASLIIKNSKRKRKLAEQQKELETQKNLTLLKEQELTTINAMVDGQEKERKRIAEDLHDNLGSVLATLKLHFENLQINKEKKKINQDELFNKTESLIDEAYLKVRSIAHAKNAGVIANQGLLTAVKMMAEKISSADKIKIEVVDFGLDKRLENSLEITVFRIIQELITNIIKHAEAKNATINISLYNKNLNIIIEDNGKGFNIKKVNLKNGMGISSIKTRVEHLKGTFKVDSTIHKGTSIIIDIPIE